MHLNVWNVSRFFVSQYKYLHEEIERKNANLLFFKYIGLTVCAAKPGSLWVLDSQLETEIHSFSESPPSDVSKYHRGPFGQRPQGP